MAEQLVSNVQKGAVSVGVLVIIIIFGFLFFAKVYPWIRGNQMTDQAAEDAKNNFDGFVDNIKICQNMASTDCICNGFSSFPAAFPKNIVLEIIETGGKTAINLKHGDEILKNATVENAKFGAMYANRQKTNYYSKKQIDFKNEPPFYVQEDIGGVWHFDKVVISPYLYKSGNELYFIIGGAKDKADVIEKMKQCS